eukprot:jgi/Hompol1/1897/HPOL_001955-RA
MLKTPTKTRKPLGNATNADHIEHTMSSPTFRSKSYEDIETNFMTSKIYKSGGHVRHRDIAPSRAVPFKLETQKINRKLLCAEFQPNPELSAKYLQESKATASTSCMLLGRPMGSWATGGSSSSSSIFSAGGLFRNPSQPELPPLPSLSASFFKGFGDNVKTATDFKKTASDKQVVEQLEPIAVHDKSTEDLTTSKSDASTNASVQASVEVTPSTSTDTATDVAAAAAEPENIESAGDTAASTTEAELEPIGFESVTLEPPTWIKNTKPSALRVAAVACGVAHASDTTYMQLDMIQEPSNVTTHVWTFGCVESQGIQLDNDKMAELDAKFDQAQRHQQDDSDMKTMLSLPSYANGTSVLKTAQVACSDHATFIRTEKGTVHMIGRLKHGSITYRVY